MRYMPAGQGRSAGAKLNNLGLIGLCSKRGVERGLVDVTGRKVEVGGWVEGPFDATQTGHLTKSLFPAVHVPIPSGTLDEGSYDCHDCHLCKKLASSNSATEQQHAPDLP